MKKKIVAAIPYFIVAIILAYCWINIIIGNNLPTTRHWIALGLILLNGAFYFKIYKWAILFTGVILLLATFNLLTFYAVTQTAGIGIGGVQLPEIQYWSLLLLIGHSIINFNLLADWYLDYKEAKQK